MEQQEGGTFETDGEESHEYAIWEERARCDDNQKQNREEPLNDNLTHCKNVR